MPPVNLTILFKNKFIIFDIVKLHLIKIYFSWTWKFHHRDPGLIGLLASRNLLDKKIIYYGIIADGIHTHPAAIKIAHQTYPEGTREKFLLERYILNW